MDKSAGGVIDMLDAPFLPTLEELGKLTEVQDKLKAILLKEKGLAKTVRLALTEYVENTDFLLLFIRGRKLNVQKAVDSVKSYVELRYVKQPDLFTPEVPGFVRYVYSSRILQILRHRDHLGRIIAVFSIENWDPSKVSLHQVVCGAGRYLVEYGMNQPEILKSGLVIVHNMKGATLGHAKHYTLTVALKIVNLFWRSYPIPIKGVFIVNAPRFVTPLYLLAKPFIGRKLADRVLITSGLDEFHQRVSPTLLSHSLGGTLPEDDGMTLEIFQRVLKLEVS